MPDTVYLTVAEWNAMPVVGLDFDTLSDGEKAGLIAQASSLANRTASIGPDGSFLLRQYVNEQQTWRPWSRRVYLYHWPVQSIDSIQLRVGAQTLARIPLNYIYTNNTERYVEVTALALALGVTPDILSLGLFEPVVEITYTAGYDVVPQDIKDATAIIASALLAQQRLREENIAGILSFTIGNYQVAVAPPRPAADKPAEYAGYLNYVPDAARLLLESYTMTHLR